MVSKKRVRNYTVIILGVGIIIAATFLFVFFIATPNKNYIRINSDIDFVRYKCPGDGTKENPFIIKNYNLINPKKEWTGRTGIWISDTTKFFVIINCTLTYFYHGIQLVNVKPGTAIIMNNTILEGGAMDAGPADGIAIGSSNATWVYNNTLLGFYSRSISISSSEDCIIEENYVANSDNGIYISDSSNITIMKNICENNNRGIFCYGAKKSTFKLNIFRSNMSGIRCFESNQIVINKNTIVARNGGLRLKDVHHAIIYYNSFYNSSEYAIVIGIDSLNITIYHNNFFDNGYEGYSQCYDSAIDSIWYNIVLSEGNYWNDLGTNSTYEIDGTAGSVDLFPLSNPT